MSRLRYIYWPWLREWSQRLLVVLFFLALAVACDDGVSEHSSDATDGSDCPFGSVEQHGLCIGAVEDVVDGMWTQQGTYCAEYSPMPCLEVGSCSEGTCCPDGQTCSVGPYLEGTDFEYRLCSGFRVRVLIVTEDEDGLHETELVEGTDYVIDMESSVCIAQTTSPMEITFLRTLPADARVVLSYPRKVSSVYP